jgi:5-methyltetrahydropteroyltriglutamate--homocysteine methyltransferase
MWNDSFPTQLVGSYHKPHWLCDHGKVYAKEGSWWRVGSEQLKSALDDAVTLAVTDQNRAGITYATDGEQRRQTFSGHFYCLGGLDVENPGEFTNFHNDITEFLDMRQKATGVGQSEDKKTSMKVFFPRITDKIRWPGPLLVDDVKQLRQEAAQRTKVTIIGPVTLAYRLVDSGVYGSDQEVAFGIADALNQELRALAQAGIDLVQIDEPEVHFRYSQCKDWAVEAIDRMVHGVNCRTAVHVCYGYSKNIAFKRQSAVYPKAVELISKSTVNAISVEYEQPRHEPAFLKSLGDKDVILGVLDLNPDNKGETVEHIIERVEGAMKVVPRERISLAPDCGMWFLPRARAYQQMRTMCLAAEVLRHQHG